MPCEKRKAIRKSTDQLLYLELSADNGGIILNLCEGGCEFQAIGPVVEKELPFSFAMGGGRQIEGRAHVAWLNNTSKGGGLCFLDLLPEVREQIGAWLRAAKVEDRSGRGNLTPARGVESEAKLRRRKLREEARLASLGVQQRPVPSHDPGVESQRLGQDLVPGRSAMPVPEIAQTGSAQEVPAAATPLPHKQRVLLFLSYILSGIKKGTAAIVLGSLLGALAISYHREVGHGFIRLGAAIAGEEQKRGMMPQGTAAPRTAPSSKQPVAGESLQSGTMDTEAGLTNKSDPETPNVASHTSLDRRPINTNDVQALWALVEGGDTRAEVLLAEHYLRGDGVTRSCGQARVLLEAATKRANAEAKRKLSELDRDGCP